MRRPLLLLALLAAAPAAGQPARPMPAYDDGGDARTYPYRETIATADIRPAAQARANREADLACAGPRATAAGVARCRRRRIAETDRAETGRAEDARRGEAAYADRVAAFHTRAAACQAGDPDACY